MALLLDPVLGDDTEGPKAPCECDVATAKRELRMSLDDIMDAHNMEWADTVSLIGAVKMIDNLVDRLVAPVRPCNRECP